MRGFKRYSFKNKYHIFSFFFKIRVLKFKRPKWKKIKSQILYYIKQYKKNKKKFIKTCFLKFLINLKYLKKKIKYLKKKSIFQFKLYLNFFKFFKKLKIFLKSKKFKLLYFKYLNKKKIFLDEKIKYKIKTKEFFFRFYFFNFKIAKKNQKLQVKSRYIFKNLLLMKHSIIKYFFGCIPFKFFRKNLFKHLKIETHKNILIKILLKPEYRIDIILCRLKIFKNPYFARFACKKNLIKLNNHFLPLTKNFLFKKLLLEGDILSFNFKYNYKKNLNFYLKSIFLPSFLEMDYYSNIFIILKSLPSLTYKDINTILKEPLCIYKFRDYLLK